MTVQVVIIAAILMDIVVPVNAATIMVAVTFVAIPILVVMDVLGFIADVVSVYLVVQIFNV